MVSVGMGNNEPYLGLVVVVFSSQNVLGGQ